MKALTALATSLTAIGIVGAAFALTLRNNASPEPYIEQSEIDFGFNSMFDTPIREVTLVNPTDKAITAKLDADCGCVSIAAKSVSIPSMSSKGVEVRMTRNGGTLSGGVRVIERSLSIVFDESIRREVDLAVRYREPYQIETSDMIVSLPIVSQGRLPIRINGPAPTVGELPGFIKDSVVDNTSTGCIVWLDLNPAAWCHPGEHWVAVEVDGESEAIPLKVLETPSVESRPSTLLFKNGEETCMVSLARHAMLSDAADVVVTDVECPLGFECSVNGFELVVTRDDGAKGGENVTVIVETSLEGEQVSGKFEIPIIVL